MDLKDSKIQQLSEEINFLLHILKNKQAELRLTVYDILNQNKSVSRTNTDSYIQDSQTNVLNRYYMLTFTYNFKKYFAKKEG